MKGLRVEIEGIPPGLLYHRMSVEMNELLRKARSDAARVEVEKQNIELYFYRDGEGRICIPAEWLTAAMKHASSDLRIGGHGKRTYKNLVGAGFIHIEPAMIPIHHRGWTVDVRYVTVQKSRILRQRPLVPEWSAEFVLYYHEDYFTKEVIDEILRRAGQFAGIGDFRPQRGGPFGRFVHRIVEEVRGRA